MTIVAQTRPFVIGVDFHARTHTYAIIEASTKKRVACEQFPTTSAGISRALAWVGRRTAGDMTSLERNTVRHRLNRGGDRRLNRALHTITMTRMVHDPGTRDYVNSRTQEGRSYREIRRSLKRYIARTLYPNSTPFTPPRNRPDPTLRRQTLTRHRSTG